MVMPAANTGSERRSRADHTNSGVRYCDRVGSFVLMAVVIKLIAPRIEETPAK